MKRSEGEIDVRVVEGVARIEDLDAFLEEIRDVREDTGTVIQVYDARFLVSREHLVRAVERAERAISRGEAIARDRAVEVLLYAAGRRQIDRALEMGVDEGETPAVAVVYAPPRRPGDGDDADPEDADTGPEDADVDAAVSRIRDLLTDARIVQPGEPLSGTDPKSVREFFDVTETELSTVAGDLTDLVLERVALLDVEK